MNEACYCGRTDPGHNRAHCQPAPLGYEPAIKAWMLDRISDAESRGFERDRLPATMEMEAVAGVWSRHLSAHFQGGMARKYWVKQRIAAQKAMTFADLRAAIEALP